MPFLSKSDTKTRSTRRSTQAARSRHFRMIIKASLSKQHAQPISTQVTKEERMRGNKEGALVRAMLKQLGNEKESGRGGNERLEELLHAFVRTTLKRKMPTHTFAGDSR